MMLGLGADWLTAIYPCRQNALLAIRRSPMNIIRFVHILVFRRLSV
jgi:hypothetical protein